MSRGQVYGNSVYDNFNTGLISGGNPKVLHESPSQSSNQLSLKVKERVKGNKDAISLLRETRQKLNKLGNRTKHVAMV